MDVDRLVAALRKALDEERDLAERMQSGRLGRVIFNLPRQTDKTTADQYLKRVADPARVLRQVAAHRKIIDEYVAYRAGLDLKRDELDAWHYVGQGYVWHKVILALAEVYGLQDSTEGGE